MGDNWPFKTTAFSSKNSTTARFIIFPFKVQELQLHHIPHLYPNINNNIVLDHGCSMRKHVNCVNNRPCKNITSDFSQINILTFIWTKLDVFHILIEYISIHISHRIQIYALISFKRLVSDIEIFTSIISNRYLAFYMSWPFF